MTEITFTSRGVPCTARRAGRLAQLREYPVDHFDVYQGRWQQRALADQLGFLSRTLAPLRATQLVRAT